MAKSMEKLRRIVMLGIILGTGVSLNAALLNNASFESTDSWIFSSDSTMLTGYYNSSWSSDGSQSYTLMRGTGETSTSYYGQITQANVDFTGITSILFDCQDTGIDEPKLQFFIGTTQIGEYTNNGHTDDGDDWGSTATVLNIEFVLPAFTGTHDFTIRLQENKDHSPGDPKYYSVDNIRFVPEPATLCLLGFGALSLIRRKKLA